MSYFIEGRKARDRPPGKRLQFKDMRDTKKISTTDDLKRSVYNQGYSMDEPKTVSGYGSHTKGDVYHRKSGEKVSAASGGNIGGGKGKENGQLGKSVQDQVNKAVRADMAKRSAVNRTEPAVQKKKDKANQDIKNKVASQQANGKSERNMAKVKPRSRMKFEEFMTICEQTYARDR